MPEERILALLNPASGNAAPEEVRQALGRHFADGRPEIRELQPGQDLADVAREAVRRGVGTIVAAGGDGSVSAAAEALIGSEARLGIIPLGTTNVLARELAIPIDLDGACALLAGPNDTARIDAMRIGGGHYFTQIGVGVDSLMIRDTSDASKRRFGAAAYLWTAATRFVGFQPRRFSIAADGQSIRPRALQVLLANCGTLGTTGLRWGPDVRVDDGRVDVCIIRAANALDYLGVAWNFLIGRQRRDFHIRYLTAERVVAIHADHSLPVQADGEVVGETPVEVHVVPRALRVVVPPRS